MENRLKEAAERFARAEETIASLREEAARVGTTLRGELQAKTIESAGKTELEVQLAAAQSTRTEVEGQLKAALTSKSGLELQVQVLQAQLQAARTQPASTVADPKGPAAKAVSSTKIQEEITRVEGTLAEVTKLIDDPASALSTVMRKNLEKAEIESYLKGIRFACGQG
jgi:hypothetical protein